MDYGTPAWAEENNLNVDEGKVLRQAKPVVRAAVTNMVNLKMRLPPFNYPGLQRR